MLAPVAIWLVVLMHRDHSLQSGLTTPASTTSWVLDHVLPDAEGWVKANEGNVSVTLIGVGPECSASDLLDDTRWDWTLQIAADARAPVSSSAASTSSWHVWTEAVREVHDWIVMGTRPPNQIIFLEPPGTTGLRDALIPPSQALERVAAHVLEHQRDVLMFNGGVLDTPPVELDYSGVADDPRFVALRWETLVLSLYGELLIQRCENGDDYGPLSFLPSASSVAHKVAVRHSEQMK